MTRFHIARQFDLLQLIDSNFSFKQQVDHIVAEVRRNLKLFKRVVRNAPVKAAKMFADGVLISRITYGLQCFAGIPEDQLSRLRVLYNDITRAVLGCRRSHYRTGKTLQSMRNDLHMLSFDSLVEFYDITLLGSIIRLKEPSELYKYLVFSDRDARESNRGNCKVNFIPKSEKMRRFFLFRATRNFNKLPRELKCSVLNPSFKDRVRSHLLYKEVPPD